MLACNVSQRERRAAIAADVVEAAAAGDQPGTGNVVFATLVDDPASVRETVDAYLGEIMREAATASATFTASGVLNAALVEEAAAAAVFSASSPAVYSAAVIEAAAAADTVSVHVPANYTVSVDEPAAASDYAQDATAVSPFVQTTWIISSARAGLGSLAYSDDMSGKAQIVAGAGVVTSALSSDVISGTVTEAGAADSAQNASVGGVP